MVRLLMVMLSMMPPSTSSSARPLQERKVQLATVQLRGDAASFPGCEVSWQFLQSADTADSAVHVEAAVAEESDQRQPTARGFGGREARRGAHGGQHRNTGHGSLLHELKAGAPADQHHRIAQRSAKAKQGLPDQFVYRVVPPDVFAQRLQLTLRVEKRGGVKPAGTLKYVLPLAQLMRKPMNHGGIDFEAAWRKDRTAVGCKRLQRFFAADPAGGRDHESALRRRVFNPGIRRKFHHHDIRAGVCDGLNLTGAVDDVFRKEKAGRQFAIVTRRSHSDREAAGAHANFERFFDGKEILPPAGDAAIDFADRDTDGSWCHKPFIAQTDSPRSEERRVGKECRSRWSPYHLKNKAPC